MQLTYRGQTYSHQPVQLPLVKIKNQLKFRGCDYQGSQVLINTPVSVSKPNLIYRGISVTHGQQRRFFGQTSSKKNLCV